VASERASRCARPRATDDEPALWHDKDLYRPIAVVRASVLAALRTTRRTAARVEPPPRPRAPSTVQRALARDGNGA